MPRFKEYNYDQDKLIPIRFSKQIVPGTFEYTLNYLIDHVVDVSVFEARYANDDTGAPAYAPAVLLKIVLYAYSRGIISSREMERACRENVLFMALSADTQPHFTTLADFISSMAVEIQPIFRDVLLYCDEMGLIGKEMFAIDGCKLPSNASKEWSGTKEALQKKQRKLERAVRRMLAAHRERDADCVALESVEKEARYLKTLRQQIKKLQGWLATHEDKPGKTGKPRQSNVTDNESAKMKTGHGVIQGYDGVAAVDAKHQIIVHAAAYGEAQEHDLLLPMIEGVENNFAALGKKAVCKNATVTADSGFHTEKNLEHLQGKHINAYIADNRVRQRDYRFADADKYRARSRKEKQQFPGTHHTYRNHDFHYDAEKHTCLCPAGKSLYRNGSHHNLRGYRAVKFTAPQSACLPCPLRPRCLKHPQRTPVRQVTFFQGKGDNTTFPHTEKMKQKIDSDEGRALYGQRLGIIEPVFGNHRNHRRDHFTLRGKLKVNIQWLLYSIVHNMGKIHVYGEGFT